MRIFSKILLAVVAVSAFQSAFSQHLNYSDFMQITQMSRNNDLMALMDSLGFDFKGLFNNRKKVFADWKINLSGILYNRGDSGLDWDIEESPDYEIVDIQEVISNCYKTYYYYFASETARDSIMIDAQQDGFFFERDGVDNDENEFTVFTKDHSEQDYHEYLFFYKVRVPGGFCIKYFREGNTKDTPDKYVLFSVEINTNKQSALQTTELEE